MDRIDLHTTVPNLTYEKLETGPEGESSAKARERVTAARKIQVERLKGEKILKNSEMGVRHVKRYAVPAEDARRVLSLSVERHSLSARGYHRVLKVARTIADLGNSPEIRSKHVLEALQYRPKREI